MDSDSGLARAVEVLDEATALVITAGAGMGVDSGLPDFRGNTGFWKAYPAYAKLGINFASMANPRWFHTDPSFAWGFYGHRMHLYRTIEPHRGFAILRRWASRLSAGSFVFTSNVDGQFQRAGFDDNRINECHGSLDWLQCLDACGAPLFSSSQVHVEVDPVTFRARGALPLCPHCGALARPNVLMFGDFRWDEARCREQTDRLEQWLDTVFGGRIVVVECGAGLAIPTVRDFGEQLASSHGARIVRINVREPEVALPHVELALGALDALSQIDALRGS
jgi:NAD-dependent SIR2 family protein deacetylase